MGPTIPRPGSEEPGPLRVRPVRASNIPTNGTPRSCHSTSPPMDIPLKPLVTLVSDSNQFHGAKRSIGICNTGGESQLDEEVARKAMYENASGVKLVSTSTLPDRFRWLFPFEFFNAVQSQAFDILYGSDRSVVLTAPTGSGKTVCFELAIARLLKSGALTEHFKVHTPSLAEMRR
jgi:DEAD/DEAH box helicase